MGRRVFRNYYEGHMDKTKGEGGKRGREVGLEGVGGRGWGENAGNCNGIIKYFFFKKKT